MTGAIVSLTITVRVFDPTLPLPSVAVYVRTYVPGTSVFTDPEVMTPSGPLTTSPAVAPGSTKDDPASNVIEALPFKVTIGGVVSTTVTVKLDDPVL